MIEITVKAGEIRQLPSPSRASENTPEIFQIDSEESNEIDVKKETSSVHRNAPRVDGRAERVNRVLMPLLTKSANPKREEWREYLEFAQQYTTLNRSTGTDPCHLLLGVLARLRDDPEIKRLLEEECVEASQGERDELKEQAREQVAKVWGGNKF